jgi:hypothetical protein
MGRDSVLNRALQGSWEHLRQESSSQGACKEITKRTRCACRSEGFYLGNPLGFLDVCHLTMVGNGSKVIGAALAVQRIGGVRCQTGV